MRAALEYALPGERQERVERALFRGGDLTIENPAYVRVLRGIMETLLETDLAPRDITVTALGIRARAASANVVTREPGVAAGLEEYAFIMRKHGLKVTLKKEECARFETAEILPPAAGGPNTPP